MKNYTSIERLDEGHCFGNNPDSPMPQELLDMKIGDLLDKVASFDSEGDAEYEALTAVLDALSSKIMPGSHEGDSPVSANSNDTVEVSDDEMSPEEAGDNAEMPTPSWEQGEASDQDDLDSFEF